MDKTVNKRIEGHPYLGREAVFQADLPPYDPTKDTEPGVLLVAPGMTVTILSAFRNWNGVAGLDILYARCHETGHSTHVTPDDLGLDAV